MKKQFNLVGLAILLFISSCNAQKEDVHWQTKMEDSAYGLTLGYSLPGQKLQEIVGDKFKPRIYDNGSGSFMLFIETSKQYNLQNRTFENLQMAHIAIPCQESINCPFTIVSGNQKIGDVYTQFNFNVEKGEVQFQVTEEDDSIFVTTQIITKKGNISIKAGFRNAPGKLKTFDSTKVTASETTSFFIGKESFLPVSIPSAVIDHEGENWISQYNLPSVPDRIWLNTDFVYDFTFTKEKNTDSEKKINGIKTPDY